ncbi:MAG TPA: hypothetical protein VMF89_09850, partial [Polyangiales bacterium]|nr:hypothetical protein [Polyangiales bacterium]
MKFVYDTGIRRKLFYNVRLCGSWDSAGKHSAQWTETPMREVRGADGAYTYQADVELDAAEAGKEFHWSVLVDGALGRDRHGVVTEQLGGDHNALYRVFTLDLNVNEQRYYLTHVRRLGSE